MSTPRILFICKNRDTIYGSPVCDSYTHYASSLSSGLLNSVYFVVKMLIAKGIDAKLVDVVDNNGIDKEVSMYKPTHVIIEALWVVPTKFDILTKLHPTVQWIVRLHSEVPFIACEGIAMDWIFESDKVPNVSIAANSKRIARDLSGLLSKPIIYLPNYYDVSNVVTNHNVKIEKCSEFLDIGCFGAIRQLKNQLIQAVAAMNFGNKIGKKIRFHINGNRVEGNADPVLKNIIKIFEKNTQGHQLISHDWMPHEDFTGVIGQMDILMQVSFSETYNIVTADAIAQNVPVVTSKEIQFVNRIFQAECTDVHSIVGALYRAYLLSKFDLHQVNRIMLSRNSDDAANVWLDTFKK